MYLNTGFFIIDPGNDAQATICCFGESRIGQANVSHDLNDTFSNTYTSIHDAFGDYFQSTASARISNTLVLREKWRQTRTRILLTLGH
jgi:hypothetical protein